MNIIAHRGFWAHVSEKNTALAFVRALDSGFGIETDFRDSRGQLVISHDLPLEGAMKIDEFIDLFKRSPVMAPIALNIKADGLHILIKELIAKSNMSNYFVFDMSVPDTRTYLSEQIRVFTRLSEYEVQPALLEQSQGVWLDAFEREWYDAQVITELLSKSKHVAIVSPELHSRSHIGLWKFLKENNFHQNPQISLCTDLPLDAKKFFNVKN
jgi:hypothetical protein